LVIIALMFSLDVLREDSSRLNRAWNLTTDMDIQKLANLKPTDSTWYEFSYDTVLHHFESLYNDTWNRRWTKVRLACQPRMERLVYFVVPWAIAYCFARPTFRWAKGRPRGAQDAPNRRSRAK
jgi:hypothetical protein